MTVQETMTKEQILPTVSQMDAAIDTIITKMYGGLEAASIEHFLQTGKVNGSFRERLYDCIKTTFMLVDIKQKTEHLKQLSAERERAGKLEHALKMFVDALKGLDATDYVAYTAGKVALIEYKQTLNEYEATRVNELTINDSKDGSPGSDKK